MFLTHRDDVAFHQLFHDHFGCERFLHEADVSSGTRDVEHKLRGADAIALADDLLVIPVPGHTRGSAALLFRDEYLFSGDHLSWSSDDAALDAHPRVCWYSWLEQVRSMEKLLGYRFRWLLPGHGEPFGAESAEAMRNLVEQWLMANR
jgi:glyoxylase-like metal-dependent hydrolase (beta-lactamase superfamily II)